MSHSYNRESFELEKIMRYQIISLINKIFCYEIRMKVQFLSILKNQLVS